MKYQPICNYFVLTVGHPTDGIWIEEPTQHGAGFPGMEAEEKLTDP